MIGETRRYLVRYESHTEGGSTVFLQQALDVQFDETRGEWAATRPGETEIVARSAHSSCIGLDYMRRYLTGETKAAETGKSGG